MRGTNKSQEANLDLSSSLSLNQIASLISLIKLQNNIPNSKLNSLLKSNDIFIPLSIFSDKISSFEAIVKYLRENLNMKNKDISLLTNRSEKSISNTYMAAKKKISDSFTKLDFEYSFPVSILKSRKYSVLESICHYFYHDLNLPIKIISKLISRNYRTVWTVLQRIKKK